MCCAARCGEIAVMLKAIHAQQSRRGAQTKAAAVVPNSSA
jgi:hypothetical protein